MGYLQAMKQNIEHQLRQAIKTSGLTHYRIGKDCGIDNHCVARFVRGEQTLRLDIAARIAAYLNLELVSRKG